METLDLTIGKDDARFIEWASKDLDVKVTFANDRAFFEAPMIQTICHVCFMAGYYKANEMHQTLTKNK